MRILDTLECEGHTACFRFTTSGGECSNKFKQWWLDVWFVIVCGRLLTLQCHSCNHFPLWLLGYRWSLDFAGPLPVTPRHNKYVLVMIEHFSKWIELVALLDKFSEGAAYSFLDRVLSHFGAPAEVLTDQGREFLGEFQTLCEQAMIDHRTTSRDHPEADGLVERMVQTVKRGLRKYNLNKGHHGDWDLQLPWIAMGYRFSKQASLASFSPYYLLFGRHPSFT
jgi:hypothetical protein